MAEIITMNCNDEALDEVLTDNSKLVREVDARLRNVIIELLKSGSIVYSVDSHQYKLLTLPDNLLFVKSYLRNLNLEVVFNSENGLAYIRNLERDESEDEGENSVDDDSLISRSFLTPFKSVLILILRKYYHERFSNGETEIVIDIDYIKNALTPYLELSVSDSRDNKKLNGALKDLAEHKLIKRLCSEDSDRILITPLIRYVIDVEKMQKMLEEFMKLNSEKIPNKKTSSTENKNEDSLIKELFEKDNESSEEII